ncbi:ribonuclease Z [Salegentibacter sp. JZCK2]|uniref:ribonuclease Z n=1 Tax=Salegentibacter tibetensis TaxID=2873600 RepID=UPI001CCCEF9E|nr:ribonuclease Z [Salegentibacter tibetensis]MBZ9730955.1 ribonuclease Z [Salegentibacter tibetensis]
MKISEKENYILIEPLEAPVVDFVSLLTQRHAEFNNKNVIVSLLAYHKLKKEEVMGFLEISKTHQLNNKSFVLVSNAITIDELPEEIVLVPSLREAEDLIQMDEIQRDLGV